MAVLDLTLDGFLIPGLENFTPDFGTKQTGGVSTLGLTKDIMMPFTKQRPVVAVETSTTTDIEANCTINATSTCSQITLGDGSFLGCTVNVYNSGNNTVLVKHDTENITKVFSGLNAELVWTGETWKTKTNSASAGSTGTNRRYLYPSVFPLANRNAKTDYIVHNDTSHSKTSVYIRSGATLPPFYIAGIGDVQYHTDTDVSISATDCDDTCNGLEAGKDYFIYLVYSPALFPDLPGNLGFKISLNDPEGISIYGNSDAFGIGTNPIKAHPEVDGVVLTAENCFCIGGFHTVCSDKTSLAGTMTHPFTGYSAGDVHPYSVWDCYHRPESTTVGMAYVPTIGKWCAIYLACERGFAKNGTYAGYGGTYPKNTEMLLSIYNKAYATGASAQKYHCARGEQIASFQKMHFPSVEEFVALSLGSPQGVNITGGADPAKSGGHKATNNQDILSYCGIEDCCGVLWQWGDESGGKYTSDAWTNAYDGNDHDVAGQYYNNPNRVFFGGYWNTGVHCGSRSAYWADGVLSLSGIVGFRLLSESAKI